MNKEQYYTPEMISIGQRGKCVQCGKLPVFDNTLGNEHEICDGCIGKLKGGDVMNACCGHGEISSAYIQYWNGDRVSGEEAVKEQRRLIK